MVKVKRANKRKNAHQRRKAKELEALALTLSLAGQVSRNVILEGEGFHVVDQGQRYINIDGIGDTLFWKVYERADGDRLTKVYCPEFGTNDFLAGDRRNVRYR